MIGYLSGNIIKKTLSKLIIEVGGIGYEVNVLPQILSKFDKKDAIQLYTHQYVREDEISLYGFLKFEQVETFKLLISISGIGPKLAFNILAATTPEQLRAAIAKTDLSVLSRIPGIGNRSASKIMLELSNKLSVEQSVDKLLFSPEDKLAIEALTNLGFKKHEAQKAIQEKGKGVESLEEKIREGLKYLNR